MSQQWFTLAELSRHAQINEAVAQCLTDNFAPYLHGRVFGDIVKYPTAAVELLKAIHTWQEQGWNPTLLQNLLADCGSSPTRAATAALPHLMTALNHANRDISQKIDQASQSFQECHRHLHTAVSLLQPLLALVAAQQEEINTLRATLKDLRDLTQIL